MIKRFGLCLALIILCFAAAIAKAEGESAVIPAQSEITLERGGRAKLAYTVVNGEESGEATWSSSDMSVVFAEDGKVTGIGSGTAEVTGEILLTSGEICSVTYTVHVTVPVKSVRFEKEKLTLYVGREAAIGCTVLPEDADNKAVRWVSSDTNVAAVDENGVITPLKSGKAVITAISESNDTKKDILSVTVLQPVTALIPEAETIRLAEGKTYRLKMTVEPADASYRLLSFASSDRSVVTVKEGVLTAKKSGTAVITCTAEDGYGTVATVTVEVYAGVNGVKLAPVSGKINVGEELRLSASVSPENAENKELKWVSSDESIATVSETGVVTPLKTGTVSISAVSVDNPAKKATVQLTVLRPVTSVALDREADTVEKGQSVRLKATVLPEDASKKNLIYTSSDPAVATVNNGVVIAKGTGTAVITVTAADGSGAADSYTVTVTQKTETVSFAETVIGVREGGTLQLTPKILPADATNTKLAWSCDNEAIATVDPDTGLVSGLKTGTCAVTAKTTDGSGASGKITVAVEPAISVETSEFARSGKHTGFYQFTLRIKNNNRLRTVSSIDFTLEFSYGGMTFTRPFSCAIGPLRPGDSKKTTPLQVGYQLTFAGDYKVYLNSLLFADGTREDYPDAPCIGSFE